MARIILDCADPNDFKSILELAEKAAGRCNVTYANQAQALIDAGTVKSEREAARKIAEETGEPEKTTYTRIRRGKEELHSAECKPETLTKPTTLTKLEKLDFQGDEYDADDGPEHEEEFGSDDDQPETSERPKVETNRSAFDRVVTETKKKEPPKHGGAREGAGRKPRQEHPRKYASSNQQFADIAISQLERIRHNEGQDDAIAALVMVKDWIDARIESITVRTKSRGL